MNKAPRFPWCRRVHPPSRAAAIALAGLLAAATPSALLAQGVSGDASYASDTTLSSSLVDVSAGSETLTIGEFLSLVESQTSLRFIRSADTAALDRSVTLPSGEDQPLSALLASVSRQSNVTFDRQGSDIVVRAVDVAAAPEQPLQQPLTPAQPGMTDDGVGDDVYIMDIFQVTAPGDETGYNTKDAVSALGYRMDIKDIPVPISVINAEQIRDLQANDMREALAYEAGVFTQDYIANTASVARFNDSSPSAVGNVNDPFQNTLSIRGYKVPNQQRNGFRVGGIVPNYNVVLGGNTDTVTTDRLEVVRGPQALLYGINVLSGVVNIVGKRPLYAFDHDASVTVGSDGYFRSTFDTTGPLIKDTLAYRFMTAYQEDETDQYQKDFRHDDRTTYALQFLWDVTDKVSLFVEGVYSESHSRGIGPQFFSDSTATGFDWHNGWGEGIRFGYDDPTDLNPDKYGVDYDVSAVVEKPGKTYSYPNLGHEFNISGPDTYRNREEQLFTALLTVSPLEGLVIEAGVQYAQLEEESRNVDIRVFTGGEGTWVNATDQPLFSGRTMFTWGANPEVAATDYRNDKHGYGVGEAFVFPKDEALLGNSGLTSYATIPPDPSDQNRWQRKFARYVWYDKPSSSETMQYRARALYNLDDVEIFGVETSHNFIVGHHTIVDNVNLVNGGVGQNNDVWVYSAADNATAVFGELYKSGINPLATDPFYLRDSVFDYEPLRYNGEVLAMPGNKSLGGLVTPGHPASELDIALSGWKEAKMWFRGTYGIYQGSFWNKRMTVIAGARRDSYQVKEKEELMVLDSNFLTDRWQGTRAASGNTYYRPYIPYGFIGYGDEPYTYRPDLPDELNAAVAADVEAYRAQKPNGTIKHNFEEAPDFTTLTAGTSFRITEYLSAYYLFSEGVFPNTGARDGLDRPIDAEQTVNNEIGLKADLFGGRLSATVSAYRIERSNGVYYFQWAPAPHLWHGTEDGPADPDDTNLFSPQAAAGPNSGYLKTVSGSGNIQVPVSYGIAYTYIAAAFVEAGVALPDASDVGSGDFWAQYGAFQTEQRGVFRASTGRQEQWVMFTYDTIQNQPIIKRAAELAITHAPVLNPATGTMVPFDGEPFYYYSNNTQHPLVNNPSEGVGSAITFEEEGTGFDGQVRWSVTKSYEMSFTASYQNREVVGNGFTLVDAVDQNGVNWGTEYDMWVYYLGIENFEDPTRPSTFTGGSVVGIDLSFVPKESFRFLNKYTFREGWLKDLSIVAGVVYNGSAPTSVAIGGEDLGVNRYLTPDTASHYEVDLSLSYRREIFDLDWRFSLRVANLLDNDEETTTAYYTNDYGAEVKRRTIVYYEPRSWRFAVSVNF